MPQVSDYLIEMHYKEKPSLLPLPTTCNVTFCFMAFRILRPSKNNELHKRNTSGKIALKCNFRNNYLKTLLNEKARWKDETNIPFVFSQFTWKSSEMFRWWGERENIERNTSEWLCKVNSHTVTCIAAKKINPISLLPFVVALP